MFDVFGHVKDFIKLDEICIDNNVFRLHYKVSLLSFHERESHYQFSGDIRNPINSQYFGDSKTVHWRSY